MPVKAATLKADLECEQNQDVLYAWLVSGWCQSTQKEVPALCGGCAFCLQTPRKIESRRAASNR
jgi:hypothetical protein